MSQEHPIATRSVTTAEQDYIERTLRGQPFDSEHAVRMQPIRETLAAAAHAICRNCFPSTRRSDALLKLEEALMHATAAAMQPAGFVTRTVPARDEWATHETASAE